MNIERGDFFNMRDYLLDMEAQTKVPSPPRHELISDDESPKRNASEDVTGNHKKQKLDFECEVLRETHRYILHDSFNDIVRDNCYGCQYDRPGQRDHMIGGCLDEDREALIDIYGKKCHDLITPMKVMIALSKLSKSEHVNMYRVEDYLKNVDYKEVLLNTDRFEDMYEKITEA